jgi:hypothetical protein
MQAWAGAHAAAWLLTQLWRARRRPGRPTSACAQPLRGGDPAGGGRLVHARARRQRHPAQLDLPAPGGRASHRGLAAVHPAALRWDAPHGAPLEAARPGPRSASCRRVRNTSTNTPHRAARGQQANFTGAERGAGANWLGRHQASLFGTVNGNASVTTVALSSAPLRARVPTRAGPCCSTGPSWAGDVQQLLSDFGHAKGWRRGARLRASHMRLLT